MRIVSLEVRRDFRSENTSTTHRSSLFGEKGTHVGLMNLGEKYSEKEKKKSFKRQKSGKSLRFKNKNQSINQSKNGDTLYQKKKERKK